MEFNYTFVIGTKLYFPGKGKFISCFNCFTVCLFLLLWGCRNNNDRNLPSPLAYNLNKPSIITLPSYLDEISGIAYYPKDKTVFAISDEKGWLYKISLSGNMAIQKWQFANKADFEDVVLADSTFYVLQSSGHIVSLHFFSADPITVRDYKLPLQGKNEFESLYRDGEQNRLIMLCKDCKADNRNSVSAWAFDLVSLNFSPKPAYTWMCVKSKP